MDTPVIFLVILALVGVISILSGYYEWTWWWRINGLGGFVYDRLGHDGTRILYMLGGIFMVAVAAKDLVVMIWATSWGKVLCIALLVPIVGFVFYARRRIAAKSKQKPDDKANGNISSP